VHASELVGLIERDAFVSIAPNDSGSVEVQCATGEQVIAGGNDGSIGMFVVASRFATPNGWRVFANNTTAEAHNLLVHAYCLAP
jgi:hypothetical protein